MVEGVEGGGWNRMMETRMRQRRRVEGLKRMGW